MHPLLSGRRPRAQRVAPQRPRGPQGEPRRAAPAAADRRAGHLRPGRGLPEAPPKRRRFAPIGSHSWRDKTLLATVAAVCAQATSLCTDRRSRLARGGVALQPLRRCVVVGQAEASCAALCKAGVVDGAATEDMDVLTFGTPVMVSVSRRWCPSRHSAGWSWWGARTQLSGCLVDDFVVFCQRVRLRDHVVAAGASNNLWRVAARGSGCCERVSATPHVPARPPPPAWE